MKVELEIKDRENDSSPLTTFHWVKSLPFCRSKNGILIHRVRRAHHYLVKRSGAFGDSGAFSHAAATFLCGAGTTGKRLDMMAEPPADRLVCEACEIRAKKMDLPSADELCGRHVHIGRLRAIRACCSNENS